MIGLTSVTFRQLRCEKIIRLAQESGASCIEWGGDIHVTNAEVAGRVREQCAQAGLKVRSYGSYYRVGSGETERFRQLCEITKALGAEVIRVWLGEKGSARTSPEEAEALAAEGRALAQIAAEYGVTVASEFHKNTYNDTGETCLRFLAQCGRENMKTYWQPMYGGHDLENLRAVFPYTEVAHLFYWNPSGSRRYPLRKGEQAMRLFLQELKAGGFQGDLLLEFVRRDSPRQFKADMQLLQRLWREVQAG